MRHEKTREGCNCNTGFAIEDHSAFRVKSPALLCDRKINERIVSPLPDQPFFMSFIGSAGTDKTSMLINRLSSKHANRKAFHVVHVVMTPNGVANLIFSVGTTRCTPSWIGRR
jgi:hypothetical protein